MNFKQLNIIEPILKALTTEGYVKPTPIQEQAIPVILEGKDLLGCAQTGTGKTAAFSIPLLQRLHREQKNHKGPRLIKALILTPTRELALQIGDSLSAYGRYTGLRHTVVYGGVSQYHQVKALMSGVDILVATPGRLLDLVGQKFIRLDYTNMFVLDEADRMLDMGFSHDMKKIIKLLPEARQTLLFSATMPNEIKKMVETVLTDPVKVEVTPASSTVDTIKQMVFYVDRQEKKSLLVKVLNDEAVDSALVFTRTKHGADRVVKDLGKVGIAAQAIHGDKSQMARQIALREFKRKNIKVLVATDIASRGIDVQELSHVINYDLPNEPETYVHRIGRTGRAGLGGIALSFCDREEKNFLRNIQKLISKTIPVNTELDYRINYSGQ